MGFTVPLAVVDALPVLLFGIIAVVLGMKLHSRLFSVGAVVCLLAGAGKVAWKLILALRGTDIAMLDMQMRVLMPLGFLLMIVGVVRTDRTLVKTLMGKAIRMPSALFFALAVVGLIAMILCAVLLDRGDVRANWIEQLINAALQGCVLIGVLLM